jgi:hypothetical protein
MLVKYEEILEESKRAVRNNIISYFLSDEMIDNVELNNLWDYLVNNVCDGHVHRAAEIFKTVLSTYASMMEK